MAIIMRNAPRGGAALVAANIIELVREKKLPGGMPMEMRPEELAHSEPHPVYIATLNDLAGGKLLSTARQTSWRYLLVQRDEAVAEAELSVPRRGAGAKAKKLEFASLTHGPFAGATVEALTAAEALPQVAKTDYELRLLKVPAVYLIALWLHGRKDDILIPMGDPPGRLKKNTPYSEADVIGALREIAQRTKQFQDAYDKNQRSRRGRKS